MKVLGEFAERLANLSLLQLKKVTMLLHRWRTVQQLDTHVQIKTLGRLAIRQFYASKLKQNISKISSYKR